MSSTKQTAPRFVSGLGMYHSNESDAKYPKQYIDISMAEIARMALNPQQVEKSQAQWVIPSTLKSRNFKFQEAQGSYGFLWADFDKDPQPISAIVGFLESTIDCKAIAYSSRSATAEKPKSRLIIPVGEVLAFDRWTMAQECLADMMAEQGFAADYAACRSAQLCYLPNRGEFYDAYLCTTGGTFDPMDYFCDRIVEKVREIERQKAKLDAQRDRAAKNRQRFVADGNTSAVDYFNATRTVQDVLIDAGYSQRGKHFCHPNSDSGSYSASVRDGRVFTLSENDPLWTGGAGHGAHDAFGAWTVLHFGGDASKAARAVYLEMKEAA